MSTTKFPALLVAVTSLTACHQIRATQLPALALKPPTVVEPALRSQRRFAVCRFIDDRGDQFGQTPHHIPVVSWFHQGSQLDYPDHAGAIRKNVDGKTEVYMGGLDEALPMFLADTLQKSGAASNTTTNCPVVVGQPGVDYVISGRIKRSRQRVDKSPILGMTLGLVGVPYVFSKFDLEYEVTLFSIDDATRPLWQHTFSVEDRRAGGHYYGKPSVAKSLTKALERSLPEAATQIASAAFAHDSRASRLTPSFRPAPGRAAGAPEEAAPAPQTPAMPN